MAPAESYLDPSTSEFSLRLTHPYKEWSELRPDFTYHGRNVYSYLLAKYAESRLHDESIVPTFDFVTVQLYEGYSHAQFSMGLQGMPASDYIPKLVSDLEEGWEVDFAAAPEVRLGRSRVIVPSSRLVIGLANGWAGDGKFLFLSAQEVADAHEAMGGKVRGYAFWNILDEGRSLPRGPMRNHETVTETISTESQMQSNQSCTKEEQQENKKIWFARGLNSFLKIRR